MDSGNNEHHHSISSSSNPNPILQPAFFDPSSPSYFPHPNSTNSNLSLHDPIVTAGFNPTDQNTNIYSNSQPPNATIGQHSGHHLAVGVSIKNPKKRTRASRRPPNTVLTTDTTNFRQMVQQFTGFPAAAPLISNFRPPVNGSRIHGFLEESQALLNLQNPIFSLQTKAPQHGIVPLLGPAKADDRVLSGFPCSSSARWNLNPNENLMSIDGNITSKEDNYRKLNDLEFDDRTEKGSETVITSRDADDQAQFR
ncbi:hypothetical protein R6Q57_018110 [Mikania cordata]